MSKLSAHINEICALYTEGKDIVTISKVYGCNSSSIHKLLIRNNIPIRCSSKVRQKYTLNIDYFKSVDTPDKAYYLGLIYADGCLAERHYCMAIALVEQDSYILEQMKEAIGFNGPMRKREYTGFQNQTILCVYNKFFHQHLKNIGLTSNKSLTITFPKLPKKLHRHFIRGYFDGDGSIVTSNGQQAISFCGNPFFLASLKEILQRELKLNDIKILKSKNSNANYYTVRGNLQVARINIYLYHKASLFLKRKKLKFHEL